MTDKGRPGTRGGAAGTSGASRPALRYAAIGIFLLVLTIHTLVNIYSILADRAEAGLVTNPREIWVWEFSSMVAWLTAMPIIWWAVKRLRPPHFGWPATIGLHLLLSIAVSAIHIALMVGLREVTYWVAGENYYLSEGIGAALIYEYRKDFATYIQATIIFGLIQWLFRSDVGQPERGQDFLIVPAGTVTHRVPLDEIEHVQAAGNYVELSWHGRTLLHRATLSSIESRLGEHGFVRIHRSRLVRRDAVRRVETKQSGDFELLLENGSSLQGSRRFRQNM